MAGTTLPTPLYVLYRARFGFSELMVTVIFATYAAGVIAALLLFGRLSDDVGRRRALVPGIALSALSAVAFLLAHGLILLLVGRVLSGLSAGIFTGTATAALVDLAPPEGKARATLVAAMANMGGLGLGPLLSGLLVQWAGLQLRLAFWVDLVLLAPALAAVLFVPEPPARQRRLRVRPQALSVPSEIRPAFVRAAMAGFAGFAVLGMFTAVSPAFLAGLLHERSHALLGVIVCVVFVASTVGQLALDRVGGSAALPLGSGGLILGALLIALSLGLSSLDAARARRDRGRVRSGAELPRRAGRAQCRRARGAPRRSGLELLRGGLRRSVDPGDRRRHPDPGGRAAHRRPRVHPRRGHAGRGGPDPGQRQGSRAGGRVRAFTGTNRRPGRGWENPGMLGKLETRKDTVQVAVESAFHHVGQIVTIITTAGREVTRELGEWATELFEMRDAARQAQADHDAHAEALTLADQRTQAERDAVAAEHRIDS